MRHCITVYKKHSRLDECQRQVTRKPCFTRFSNKLLSHSKNSWNGNQINYHPVIPIWKKEKIKLPWLEVRVDDGVIVSRIFVLLESLDLSLSEKLLAVPQKHIWDQPQINEETRTWIKNPFDKDTLAFLTLIAPPLPGIPTLLDPCIATITLKRKIDKLSGCVSTHEKIQRFPIE